MLNAKLMVVGGDAKASEIQLNLPTVIGRGREVSLTLPHPLVSRRHTEIFERDGRLVVKDLGSLNGTFVNNQKIEDEQILEPNQLLTLGNVTFRAIYEVVTSEASPSGHTADAVELADGILAARDNAETEAAPDVSGSNSFADSHIFIEVVERSPQQSIALSQLNALPGTPSAVDLGGSLDLENTVPQRASTVDPDDFQFEGLDNPSAVEPDQSGLGSFLKKLPR